ncbi:MAG: hypothetical protein MMC23_007557 [Stictis urceolatum]|nr:hypothetical protein [Stictis urceolata]
MGCFRLDTEDRRDYPLDAKQVHYLVERGYVDYQQIGIHKSEIDDRDKGDGILLLITVVQILWFSFNLNGRAWFGNSLTPLELTAIASVLPMLVTFWLWRQKPLGVGFTITLKPTVSIGEMREAHERHVKELGIPSREKCAMPLDCAGRELFPWNRYRTREQGTLGTRKVKIPDDNFPSLPKCAITLCMVFQGLYAGIHVWGWDLFFPTDLERTLWRYGSLILAGCLGGFWLNHFFTYFCRERLFAARRRSPGRSAQTELGKKTEDPENGLDTSTSSQVIGLLPILALAICYVVVRMFIIVESFASLRMLPEDAFKLIRLNDILPSFT